MINFLILVSFLVFKIKIDDLEVACVFVHFGVFRCS